MIKNYLKVALKVLGRRKFFTFISLFGICLTLLVLMVATAMLDEVFAPQAPEVHGDRTLGIYQVGLSSENIRYTGLAGYGLVSRVLRDLPAQMPAVERTAIFSQQQGAISYLDGRRIESYLKRTDGEFWRILDFHFLEGQPFSQDDEANGRHVAVINESTRQRFFQGQPAVGKTIEIDGQSFRVVGVVRDVPFLRIVPFSDVWVPISTIKSSTYRNEYAGNFVAILLARSRADFPAVKAEVARRMKEAEAGIPNPEMYKTIDGGADTLFESFSRTLFSTHSLPERHPERLLALLLLLMVLFMVLPTVNLVNINLSRILDRSSEIGVRKAFGASSRTLVGQFVIENVVLTLIGAGIGLALAAAVLAAINASGMIPYADLHLNFRIFLYGLVIALFFGLFSGVYPAWRMSKLHPVQALRGRQV
ncbi:MAG TPA: ABC transporter permease [Thermoanaerobaculia bacterium]|nr:ABC transporter permease [Thermoanaerobaculia bacterium]